MKKIVLSSALILGCFLFSIAQSPVKFGLKAGVTFPSQIYSAMGISYTSSASTSFYVGTVAEMKLSPIFSFQPGLSLVNKGAKINLQEMMMLEGIDPNDPSFAGLSDVKVNFTYLELPLNVMANFNAGLGKVFVGAGPYLSYALSGNTKVGGMSVDTEFGSGEDQVKRMDIGLNFLGGYQFKNKMNIHAGYGIGLSSLANDNSAGIDSKVKNKVLSVGLGYMF